MINSSILKSEEKVSFALRSLYSRFGYGRYKMNKFEEYDLYVRNKDFLISDGVITFTDTNGKLLALKPDVTLSIIKNMKDIKGFVQKLYYDEHVYRISKDSHSFREIAQTGLECIGDIGLTDICEVVYLSLMSLGSISESYILDLSHAGLMTALFDCIGLKKEDRSKVISLINEKNYDGVKAFGEEAAALSEALMTSHRDIDIIKRAAEPYFADAEVKKNFDELEEIYSCLCSLGMKDKINIDFSIVSDISYYSGTLFKGYVEGIPSSVLSGGQYDGLMKKMGKSSGAVGFAVYLDMLERFGKEEKEYDYDTVVLVSDQAAPEKVIKAVSDLSAKGERVIALKSVSDTVRYKNLVKIGEGENND
ncbi:MAG: ATP phosphoribosyltransferase regulatory subunit [Clostridia bacterium]|nr:ATP phosphoribosyltransferase regulatory subunit [Clostridia bacterium]